MSVVTRFAPSPTGYLHIGGARTALFAWAYAKQQGGKFFLRIEDTDLARSDAAHSDAIIHAMEWLELSPDAPPVFQSANRALHQEKIQQLLQAKRAYYCYTTPEELEALRTAQIARGENPKYNRRWRDCDDAPPPGAAPVVRFKMPETGQTTFHDAVKGALTVATDTLDDFIIARADGTPTYNLAAVVDDIAMGVTHVIRGDDHVMNTYRQWHLFMALANQTPVFAHLPMILTAATNEQGQVQTDAHGGVRYVRMSKRHAAVDITQYRREGFLPQALCNYLARLSWAHGDAEVFARDFFAEHFSFAAVSQSPARFDWEKLKWLNRSYLQRLSWRQLCEQAGIEQTVGEEAVELIRQRAHTLKQIKQEAVYFTQRPTDFPAQPINQEALKALYETLADLPDWQAAAIKQCMRQQSVAHQLNFKQLGMPLRAALTGREESPDIAAIAAVLGQEESLQRLKKFLQMHKN